MKGMRLSRRHRTLRRRYGRASWRYEAGARPIDEMLSEMEAPTMRVPRLTMRQQLEFDRAERTRREREERAR